MNTVTHLSSRQIGHRVSAIAFLGATIFMLRFIDPVAATGWLPVHLSCNAVTGLPCIFCGLTRALHLLMNGSLARALYFNWLAFPILAAIGFLIALFLVEIAMRQSILKLRLVTPITAKQVALVTGALIALWIMQAYLAVSQDKEELLNPRGPLYALFVK
ncbi:MAG TPA: DUF2752 domain-containing protein [Chthoniobacterales bacterium]|jgi:hypothetical protein